MITSYHNHTTWSDGKEPLEKMVQAAIESGVDEIGISDHLTLSPFREKVSWSMATAFLPEYVTGLRVMAARQTSTTLRLGLEADFFPETVEPLKKVLSAHPFDYVLGGIHFLGDFPLDESPQPWSELSPRERDSKWRHYWITMKSLAESGIFTVVAHLDLPKKYGFFPTIDVSAEETMALQAIAKSGMAVEINTSGWFFPAREAYPSPALLRQARFLGIPIMINADAHQPEHITRNFSEARRMAGEAGYKTLVRAEKGRLVPIPL